jgi:hypothetical protein
MDECISTRSTDLVELRVAVGAAGEVLAAVGIAHLGLELVGVRAAAEGGVLHLSPRAMAWIRVCRCDRLARIRSPTDIATSYAVPSVLEIRPVTAANPGRAAAPGRPRASGPGQAVGCGTSEAGEVRFSSSGIKIHSTG